ncbi:hypothetical protein Q6348_12510 [Isoptericola sp. b441]|uniref:STAS domain-containing protein n=1 Tax=Actinotalea lenta TaxID=3064654 RepID=A0ABT9DAT8_9CELL|nr:MULTISPECIES: hypothetical protein [unclassified Isoptericola]MDO8108019.1 hypothetical protein [Isoptericola sp. b441]MDO8120311.1 hypothetical protein [Isoptericola sp. b490]
MTSVPAAVRTEGPTRIHLIARLDGTDAHVTLAGTLDRRATEQCRRLVEDLLRRRVTRIFLDLRMAGITRESTALLTLMRRQSRRRGAEVYVSATPARLRAPGA